MRIDGRKPDELRPVTMERSFTKHAAGSVLVSFGDTRVLCTASVDERVPPWMRDSGRGWVTAEYGMLPGSTHTRMSRDKNKKGRALEISRLIGRSLRAVTNLEALGPCQITLDCDVIQADGGTRTAAITGAYVALRDALQQRVNEGHLDALPLTSSCAAVSVGVFDGEVLLDLNYHEDSSAEVDMNVVMNGEGEFLEVQGTSEEKPFAREAMNQMLDSAQAGIQALVALQHKVLSDG